MRSRTLIGLLSTLPVVVAGSPWSSAETLEEPTVILVDDLAASPQDVKVPDGVCRMDVDMFGGVGGGWDLHDGGLPARVQAAQIEVVPGEVLTIVLGGNGAAGEDHLNLEVPVAGGEGGVNGGGAGGDFPGVPMPQEQFIAASGAGGGGATEIRRNGAPLVVAGGGGGASFLNDGGHGGLVGHPGGGAVPGLGGTATEGGLGGDDGAGAGSALTGGAGSDALPDEDRAHAGGGGGGGWFGGGGGGRQTGEGPSDSGGGGGGSSLAPAGATVTDGAWTIRSRAELTLHHDSCPLEPPGEVPDTNDGGDTPATPLDPPLAQAPTARHVANPRYTG